jgi:hypothetical protein
MTNEELKAVFNGTFTVNIFPEVEEKFVEVTVTDHEERRWMCPKCYEWNTMEQGKCGECGTSCLE